MLVAACWLPVKAQQYLQLTQVWNTRTAFNPAIAGTGDALIATALYRTQWVGLPGNPTTQFIGTDMPLYDYNSGVGLYAALDRVGLLTNLHVKGVWSYIRTIGSTRVSGGLSAGVIQMALDGSRLRAPEGQYNDPINHNDRILPVGSSSGLAPDFGLGIYVSSKDIRFGLSALHVTAPSVTIPTANDALTMTHTPHLYTYLGFLTALNDDIKLMPMAFLKTDGGTQQMDLFVMATFNDFVWGGLGYRGVTARSKDALMGSAGVYLSNDLSLGYSYDLNISGLRHANSGSHEISLKYRLAIEKEVGKVINNPRFLSY